MGLGEAQPCGARYNDRASALTGTALLSHPHPPPPIVITGRDGRSHSLAYRVLPAPAGVEIKLEETGVARARAMTSPSWAITMRRSLRSFVRSSGSPSAQWPASA